MSLHEKLPQPILAEDEYTQLRSRESYHVLKIISEFVNAGEELRAIHPAVSIFGSARIKPESPIYQKCEHLAHLLSNAGFSVISGGGPGIMEAANKGAFTGKSPAVGLNIELPHEQQANPFQDLSITFKHFFPRKVMFIKHAIAYVVMPGGFGTLDEMFEALTLIQTKKASTMPIILCGQDFWQGLIDWIKEQLLTNGLIHTDDIHLMHIIDEPEEIVDTIFKHYETIGFDLKPSDKEMLLGL